MSTELTIPFSSPLLDNNLFNQMKILADMLSTDTCIPPHLKGSAGACLRLVEMAYRTNQSPFALADSTYFIGGKIAYDGKLIAALINSHPSINGSLKYKYEGNKNNPKEYFIIVTGSKGNEEEVREVKISLEQGLRDSKGAKSRWENDSDQMLAYYGSRVWARRHAPEIIMGLYTPDELNAGKKEKNITNNENSIDVEFMHLSQEIKSSTTFDELQLLTPALREYSGSKFNIDELRETYRIKMLEIKAQDIPLGKNENIPTNQYSDEEQTNKE